MFDLLGKLVGQVVGNFFPNPEDKQKAMELQIKLQCAIMENDAAIQEAAAKTIQAEATSGNWLAASWRPITMLVFVWLVVARMFGWTVVSVPEAEYLELWGLIKLGLGGYVIGRSAEKITPGIVTAIKGK